MRRTTARKEKRGPRIVVDPHCSPDVVFVQWRPAHTLTLHPSTLEKEGGEAEVKRKWGGYYPYK